MATSRRDTQQVARVNRGIQNVFPGLKPSESNQGLRRARSVPTSPDRRSAPSSASISDNACRPASSFNARTTSSRSTTSSSASSSHAKTLRSASSSMAAGARQTNTARRKAEKPGATSVWPPAAAVPNASSKDMARAAKSPSTTQKSNSLSTRPGIEKAAASSVKLKPQKTVAGPLGAGKTQAASTSTRAPGTITKKRTGAENYVSIQRTTSVPATARQIETPKNEEQDVELLMEFDEKESISTSSIEEHLHERLPDPVDLKSVDLDSSKTSSSQEEYKDQENTADILEEKRDGKDSEDLSAGDKAYVGNSDTNILMKEAVDESELVGAVDETGLKKDVCGAELNETVNQHEFNEAVSETESKEAGDEAKIKQVDCETASKEAASGTESRDAVTEHELVAQEKARTKEKMMQPMKAVEFAKWRKDEGRSSEAAEEGRSKSTTQERKNKVMALVGRFETAMSG